MEKWRKSRIRYDGSMLRLRTGEVELPGGRRAEREVVEHAGSVAVVAVHDGEVLLVRQYRIAIGRELLELPAGKLEPGETPATSARRELEEETGFTSDTLQPLAQFYTSAGFTDEKLTIFFANDLRPVDTTPEWDEQIEVVRLPVAAVRQKLLDGEFEDAKTLVGLQAALLRGWLAAE